MINVERIIEGYQTAYCPKVGEDRDIYLEIFEVVTLGNIKHFGFKCSHCPEQQDCEYADFRGFCPLVKTVLATLV